MPFTYRVPSGGQEAEAESAWSSKDPESFDALVTAAVGDPGGAEHVRDLFVLALQ